MKIGILTYHHVVNIGSILQAWSVVKFFERKFPAALVEIIDYVPSNSIHFNRQLRERAPAYKGKLAFCLKQLQFRRFLRRRCKFSRPISGLEKLEDKIRVIDDLGYDIIVVGSDTVFQMDGYFGNPIAEGFPPNLYFLPGDINCTKIGFSASADPVSGSPRSQTSFEQSKQFLKDFDVIFFRDADTETLLRAADVKPERLSFLSDPTILYGDELQRIYGDSTARVKNEQIGVYIGHPPAAKAISHRLRDLGMKPIDLFGDSPIRLFGGDPIVEYVKQFQGLCGLITDRFHGTIIASLLGDYPVMGLVDKERYPTGGKLRDLYSRLRISGNLLEVTLGDPDLKCIVDSWSMIADRGKSACLHQRLTNLRLEGEHVFEDSWKRLNLPVLDAVT